MNPKRAQAAAQIAQPMLRAGEHIVQVGMAAINPISFGASVARGLLTAVASAGTLRANTAPTFRYLVLTDQRIIFLASSALLRKPTDEVVVEIPRAEILAVSEDRKKGLGMTFDLALEGQQSGFQLLFAAGNREDAQAISAELRSKLVVA